MVARSPPCGGATPSAATENDRHYILSTSLGLLSDLPGSLNDPRRRVAGDGRNRDHLAAGGFNFFPTHDFLGSPVATFDEDVRQQARDNRSGSGVVEDCHVVHGLERGEDFGSLVLREDRAPGAFELADAPVAVQRHQENIAQLSGFGQIARVPGVKQIETSVCENDALALPFELADGFISSLERQNFPGGHFCGALRLGRFQLQILPRAGWPVGASGAEAFAGQIPKSTLKESGIPQDRAKGGPILGLIRLETPANLHVPDAVIFSGLDSAVSCKT